MAEMRLGFTNVPTEWSFVSGREYADPFSEVELDAIFQGPDGKELRVPAFWAGGSSWRVRFATSAPGRYSFKTVCSRTDDRDLHAREGILDVRPYQGPNELLRRGPLRVASDGRHIEHADGRPFFWLGDTWWLGLASRLAWPDEFRFLAADRKAKGFSVVQLVAGLFPDMAAFDPRGVNEAGFAWEEGFARVNPAFYDMADLRIACLVEHGIVPCIVGSWGYYLPWMGVERLEKHWRNLIARWGAYPVVWCLAGEAAMPYYLSRNKDEEAALQKRGWTELARYVRRTDPFGRPITTHPTYMSSARDQVEDDSVFDLDMLQSTHDGFPGLQDAARLVVGAVARAPAKPVVNGEVCYEGIFGGSWEDVQRFCFWSAMLSGAAGHTYGANGIWQANAPGAPYGPSPHGIAWGDTPWREAAALAGSTQVGIGKRLLERYEWWRFESRQDWIEPAAGEANRISNYCAGIPGRVRIVYFPRPIFPWGGRPKVKGLEAGSRYGALFFDPRTGREAKAGEAAPAADGSWQVPLPPTTQDWVLVLERRAPA